MTIIDKLKVEIGADTKDFQKGANQTKTTLGDIEKQSKKSAVGAQTGFQKLFTFLKTQLLALGPVIAAVFSIGAIKKFYGEIDRANSSLIKATGASGEALKSLQNTTNTVFKQVPQDLETVADVVGALNTRLGLTGDILEQTTKQILDFSRITGTDAKQNVADITRLTQDWGIEAENTGAVLDLLTQAGLDSDVNINQLTNTLVNSGVQLRTLGFSLGTATALLSKFEKEGVNTAGILSGLNRGVNELAQTTGKSVPEAFGDFIESLEQAKSDSEALALATATLGSIAGPQFALAVREGRFELDDYIESLQNADGVTERIAESSKTAEESFKIFTNTIKGSVIPVFTGAGEVIGVVGNKFLELGGIIKRTLQFIAGLIATTLIGIGEGFWKTLKFIFDNVKLIPKNFGIAFDNIPGAIEKGLKSALKLVGEFINTLTFGLGGKVAGFLGLGKITDNLNFFGSKDIKFQTVGFEDFSLTKKSLQDLGKSFSEITNGVKKEVKETQGTVVDLFKTTEAVANDINKEITKSGKEKSDELLKQEQKLQEDLDKLEKEREERFGKYLIEREERKNKKLKDSLKLLEDGYKSVGAVFDKSISESQKRTNDFIENIKKLNSEIRQIEQELSNLEQGRAKTLGQRNVEIENALEKLRAEEIIDIQKINELLEEQRLIQSNATQEELNEAKRLSKLSPTALFLEQFEQKKKALEEDKILREEEIRDIEEQKEIERQIFEDLTKKKEELDLRYEKLHSEVNEKITDKLHIETEKRIASIEKQRQAALRLIETMQRAGLATSNASSDISSVGGGTSKNEINIYGNQNFNNGTDIKQFSEELSWKTN